MDRNSYRQNLTRELETRTERIPLPDGTFVDLDEHQEDAIIAASLALQEGRDRFSIIHATGSGKTHLEANILSASTKVKKDLGSTGNIDLILTTERALKGGIKERLKALGVDVAELRRKEDKPTVLATIQALQRNKSALTSLLPIEAGRIPLVIGDEADLMLTKARKEILDLLGNPLRIGFTATPTWPDGREVSEAWGEIAHRLTLREGILRGINAPPLFELFEAGIDGSRIRIQNGDYDQKELDAALRAAEIHKSIPEVYRGLIPSEDRKKFPTLIYVPSVALVKAVVDTMQKEFGSQLSIKGWTGDTTSSEELKTDVNNFNAGKLQILVLCEMGGRGIDVPRARCIIDAYPTQSANKLEQRHGRGLRTIRSGTQLAKESFEKPFCINAQITFNANGFRGVLLPDILDAWDDFKEGKLLIHREGAGGNGTDEGRSRAEAVEKLRAHIEKQKLQFHVQRVKSIDIYKQLKLRDELPEADEDGFFTIEVVEDKNKKLLKYGSIPAWSRELKISIKVISNKLLDQSSMKGIYYGNHITNFYPEYLVRELCKDHLKCMLVANKNGFLIEHGMRYGTIRAWARVLEISEPTISTRVEGKGSMRAKVIAGNICDFYAEYIVREACKDLLEEMSQANEIGFFEVEEGKGENKKSVRYGTIRAWARLLEISEPAISTRVEGKESKIGKIRGQVHHFYPESVVREGSKDLLEISTADENGFFEKDGEQYGTINAWSKKLGLSFGVASKRIGTLTGISGKRFRGQNAIYYRKSDVIKKCKDVLTDHLEIDENGFCQFEGELFGTLNAWFAKFGRSEGLRRHFDPKEGKTAISRSGNIIHVYSENNVKEKMEKFPARKFKSK